MTKRDVTIASADDASALPATYTHPEEMLFAMELRLPGQSAVAMRFRTTPAGLIATGIMSALTLAGVALIWRRR